MRYLALILLVFSTVCFSQFKETQRQELSSVNLLGDYNPGFENMSAKWAKTGSSTFAVDSSNYRAGTSALSWDASASGEYLTSEAVAVTDGLKGNACMAGAWFKYASGSSGDVKLQAYDGTNVLAEKDINTSDYWFKDYVAFTCPTSGNIQFRLASTADAEAILLDQVWLGEQNNLVDVSQAEFFGAKRWEPLGGCIWHTSITSFDPLLIDSTCDEGTINLEGNAIADASNEGEYPRIRFASLPPGNYFISVYGRFETEPTGAECTFGMTDGTTDNKVTYSLGDGAKVENWGFETRFKYETAQGDTTFSLAGLGTTSVSKCKVDALPAGLTFNVKRLPLSSEKAVSLDTQGWHINANIYGGTFDLGDAEYTSYTEITNSAASIEKVNEKSADVGIACSSTNDNTVGSTTCSSGSESLGIVVNIPYSGVWNTCFAFTHSMNSPSGEHILDTFQVVQTGNGSQTILQEGGSKIQSSSDIDVSGNPINICGVFNFVSAGKKTIRVMREQSVAGTPTNQINVDRNSSYGQRDIHVVMYPLIQNFPQVVAITDINPTYMSASAATKAGYYEYVVGQTYNNSHTIDIDTASGAFTIDAESGLLVPYQTTQGNWRLRGNLIAESSSVQSNPSLTLSGIKGWSVDVQAIACIGDTSPSSGIIYSEGATHPNRFDCYSSSTATDWRFSFDVRLHEKPTWAY